MSNPGKSQQAVPRAAGGRNAKLAKTVVSVDGCAAFNLSPAERIAVIRQGIPAAIIASLCVRMGLSKETLLTSLGLSHATISRKKRQAAVLSPDESERVLGVEALIGMVQTMVEESGDPTGFDAYA
jgi:uncharacterized protein (DUF2384 family)